ncbi:hypothetical protein [Bacillus sp. JJ1764]|uniref:hypothetical protein n=1 Tax=Bacillus sp. JJ1764 TaxID=3122964 RepID=UPI0030008316
MELEKVNSEQPAKKAWEKPILESLSISKTEYWEFRWNDETNFWQNVWVSMS